MPIIQMSAERKEEYKLTLDAFHGYNQFAHGGALFNFGRELDFKERMNMASYINLMKPIVDARVDPIFVKEPTREYEPNDAILEMFLDNSDNNDTDLEKIIKHTVKETVLLGNSFIVMDNFPESEIPETMGEVIEQRKFPYVYTKSVIDVYEYETDIFNKLESITFYYGLYLDSEDEYLYKRFTKKDIEYILKKKEKTDNGELTWVFQTIAVVPNNLGMVPVAYFNKDVLPFPPYYSMATLARKLYNIDSAINELSRNQLFSILLIPSTSPTMGATDIIEISTSNALFFDASATNKPEYIQPDASIMTAQLDYRQKYFDTFLQSADVLGTSAMGSGGSKSGVAYSYEFYGKMQQLLEGSSMSNGLEEQVIHLLGLFRGQIIPYSVAYLSTFSPTFTETQQKIDMLIKIADLEMSDTVTFNMNADIVQLVGEYMEWDDERITKCVESVVEVDQIV